MAAEERTITARNGKADPVRVAVFGSAALLCAALLSACGDKGDKSVSQVAARVNDQEITISQVNRQLALSGITDGAEAKKMSGKILDALIDQELLVQEAKRKRLDRDPAVMQSIEDAKRQILSQAYLERSVYNGTPTTADEIKAFYASHPELFAKRKAYKLNVLSIPKDKFNEGLKAALDSAKTEADAVSILKARAIDFKSEELQWLAEQVPMEILPTLVKMKTGDIALLEQGNQMALIQLESSVDNPVSEAQAKPVIEKYITGTKNKALLDDKIKQLRKGEKITYVGPFADTLPATDQPVPESKPAQDAVQPHIQKGLEGLK